VHRSAEVVNAADSIFFAREVDDFRRAVDATSGRDGGSRFSFRAACERRLVTRCSVAVRFESR